VVTYNVNHKVPAMNIIYSQESIFHLYRLGSVVNKKTKRKYKLSNKAELNALIRYCERSGDALIKDQFKKFIASVDADTVSNMGLSGLILGQSAGQMQRQLA
jgi:hypothetical protein